MAGMNRRACCGLCGHPARIRGNSGDIDRRRDTRASQRCGSQEVGGEAARVGCQLVVAQDRCAPLDPEAPLDVGRIQQCHVEARAAARVGFVGQAARVEDGPVEIKRVPSLETGIDPQVPGALIERVHRQPGALPDAVRLIGADSFRQAHQRQIEIVLNQCGRGRGGAAHRAAPVSDDDAQSRIAEAVGRQSSADSRADNEDVGRNIAAQWLVCKRRKRRALPD